MIFVDVWGHANEPKISCYKEYTYGFFNDTSGDGNNNGCKGINIFGEIIALKEVGGLLSTLFQEKHLKIP